MELLLNNNAPLNVKDKASVNLSAMDVDEWGTNPDNSPKETRACSQASLVSHHFDLGKDKLIMLQNTGGIVTHFLY